MLENLKTQRAPHTDKLKPDTILIFRATKKRSGYPQHKDKMETNGSYHMTYSLRIFQGHAKAICGKFVTVDTQGVLQVMPYDELKEDLAFLSRRSKKYLSLQQQLNGEEMCKRCLDRIMVLASDRQQEQEQTVQGH